MKQIQVQSGPAPINEKSKNLVTKVIAEVYSKHSQFRASTSFLFRINNDLINRYSTLSYSLLGGVFSRRTAAGLISLIAFGSLGFAAETNSVSNASTQSDVQQLRDEVKALREELKAIKDARSFPISLSSTNSSTTNSTSQAKSGVEAADVDALKDVLDEKIIRSLRSRYTVNFSGYVIAGYSSVPSKSDTFSPVSGGLSLSGFVREDPSTDGDLKYKLSLATYSKSGTLPAGVNATDANLTWDLLTTKGNLDPAFTTSLTLGQQLVPYGSDNQATEDKIPTIRKAQYLSNLGISRDIGLVDQGGLFNYTDPASGIVTPYVGYWLGVLNGSGANTIDNNHGVDFVGKLQFSPFPNYFSNFRGLKIGGDYYEGNLGPSVASEAVTKRRYGADIEWLRKPFLLTGEYVHGIDGRVQSDSYVGTLFWSPNTLPDFQPWIRYDRYEDNATFANSKNIYSIGLNYFLYQVEPVTRRVYETTKTERVVKLQLGYDYIDQLKYTAGNHQITGQVTVSF